MVMELRKRKSTIPEYFPARKRVRFNPVRRRLFRLRRRRTRRVIRRRPRRVRRVRLNKVLNGVIRWESIETIAASAGKQYLLDFDKIKTKLSGYLDRYKDIFQFFQIASISQRNTCLDPDVLNQSNALMRTWAKCYDAQAEGRQVSEAAPGPFDNMLRNPTCKRGVWRPGSTLRASLKPRWTNPVGLTSYAETFNKKTPWWSIDNVAAVPNSANGVHVAFTTPQETKVFTMWTVRLRMKGRDNDMPYKTTT